MGLDDEFEIEWSGPELMSGQEFIVMSDREFRFRELDLGVDRLESGMKVVLQDNPNDSQREVPDNPIWASRMDRFKGEVVTIHSFDPEKLYCGTFCIEEDVTYFFDPRWIDHIVPCKDEFEAASDDVFEEFLNNYT